MIDSLPGLPGVILFCIAILIFTAIATLTKFISVQLIVAIAICIALTIAYTVIGIILRPRPMKDHYEKRFEEYPYVG